MISQLFRLPSVLRHQAICLLCHHKVHHHTCASTISSHQMSVCGLCQDDLINLHQSSLWRDLKLNPAALSTMQLEHLHQCFVLFDYQWPYDNWITRLKFHADFAVEPALNQLALAVLAKANLADDFFSQFDYVLAVPMHKRHKLSRGFNQVDRLISEFYRQPKSGLYGFKSCQWQPDLIQRVKVTRSQVGLSAAARRKNLNKAFDCQAEIAGKHVLLIDDVVTTGTTLDEIAKQALEQGAASVSALVFCWAEFHI